MFAVNVWHEGRVLEAWAMPVNITKPDQGDVAQYSSCRLLQYRPSRYDADDVANKGYGTKICVCWSAVHACLLRLLVRCRCM